VAVSLAEIRESHAAAFSAACPTRVVLDHVMSKWGILVLLTLGDGTARWGELRRGIDGISEKMLATTLKTLEGDGLVQRTSYPEVPPRVEYALTALGHDLMLRLGPLMEWIAVHADQMVGTAASD